jgi:hypothetical protein
MTGPNFQSVEMGSIKNVYLASSIFFSFFFFGEKDELGQGQTGKKNL